MRSARPSSEGSIGIGVIYGLGAGLVTAFLVYALSVAVERAFFSPAREPGEEFLSPASPAAVGRVARVAASSYGEDDRSIDPAAPYSDRAAKRGPATWQDANAAPQPTKALSPRTSARDQAPDKAWWNPLPAVANAFSFGGGGGTSGAPNSAGSGPNGGQVREVFFGTSADTACQPGHRQFILNDVADLHVCVVWAGLSGKYAEQLTFVLPDGHVYQTMTVPFVTADIPADVDPMIEVGGRQLEAKRAGWGANGEVLVTARLPVGGTLITQHTLVGLWTVQVALNGQRVDQDNFELLTQ